MTLLLACLSACTTKVEDGHDLWLRMPKNLHARQVTTDRESPTARLAVDELESGWQGGAVTLHVDERLDLGDGYSVAVGDDGHITVSASSDAGLLYGAYALLRAQQTGVPVVEGISKPHFALRILNHWDNLDGSIERGYAGRSIFWGSDSVPVDDVLRQYARANASVGINGTVLNNVNASPQMLSPDNLAKVKRLADAFRPYGLRVYLAVNFASPMDLGGLSTADPLKPQVRAWWQAKVDEIYQLVPDFGGFLVKANSEGQPGPGDYGRTHAEGANMLAEAIAPHGGIIMWRAFVYGYHDGEDRVKKAVSEFKPLDGQFLPNVILQIKNGPLDFQPREPYSPLFDQMEQMPMMAELQITQEYTGQSRHLVFLAPMWTEFFGFVDPASLVGVAGVSNIGDDVNWCGHHFSQANWYAFGRLAWDPGLTSRQIAEEWLRQTFTTEPEFVEPVAEMMLGSREACVDYMMPLGLHHIFKDDHHYGPYPEGNSPDFPDEWKPVWYHKADSAGVGFNRSSTGTDAVAQYRSPYRELYDDPATCPDDYLLWFHHLPWDYTMRDGSTLWQSLCRRYNEGVAYVDGMEATWQSVRKYVDARRWSEVEERLQHQQENAREWRDHCLGYFHQFSGMPYENE